MSTACSPADLTGMVWLPGGEFTMGSDKQYPEEGPARRVSLDGFSIDVAPVTNREFAAFVAATGYVTMAERVPSFHDYPDADPSRLRAGSMVFHPPGGPVPLGDITQWWSFVPGAQWRRPYGPETSIENLTNHPVVHVTLEDARAFAAWAGKDLPTEAESEYAARGGLDDTEYAWGNEFMPGGRAMANTWHGTFPHEKSALGEFERTSPVGHFPANGFGLIDMIGNVWEWTSDYYARRDARSGSKSCCVPHNPRITDAAASVADAAGRLPRMVLKGGSHLCAPNYCRRYRPAARQAHDIDTSTTHIGFRCVKRSAA